MNTILISGADRGIGYAMTEEFLKHGYEVFAGQFLPDWPQLGKLAKHYPKTLHLLSLDVSSTASIQAAYEETTELTDHIDILLSNAGIGGEDTPKDFHDTFNINALGLCCLFTAFQPLLERGGKRVCVVSSEAGCISLAHRADSFAYCMSKTALNMSVRMLFNRYRPQGYTFRLYHPGWVKTYMDGGVKSTEGNFEAEETAASAFRQFTGDSEWEDVLVMRDISFELWPF